jgi:DNA-binding SARP family transcriptional activator
MPKLNTYIKIICLLLVSVQHVKAQQFSGLIFASRETAPEKRTVLNLTPDGPVCLSDSFQINFDISFVPGKERYSGYVFRIIDQNNENIDLLFDGRDRLFKVVYKEKFTAIIFPASVFNWNKFSLRYDSHAGISFWLNGKFVARSPDLFKDICLRIFFGANYYHGFRNTDLPSMEIKNLEVTGGAAIKYFWPLNELEGEVALDSISNKKATVLNPLWVRSQHERWESAENFTVKGNPSVAFDPVTEHLFVVNNDSLYTYDTRTKQLTATALSKPGIKLPEGNQSIYDPAQRKLYNFYIDRRHISVYDSAAAQWEPELSADRSLTAYWHVNKFISGYDSCLYIFGGYGYNKYKNTIQRVHLYQHTWDTMKVRGWDTVKTTGDYFEPRYLSALGQNAAGDTAYLLGGYGSQSGDQMLSPGYYYDLFVFDVRNRRMKKRFTLQEPEDHFVLANSLVINNTERSYYALVYPKDRFDTRLRLIKGSLTEPSYQLLGDEIPYWFNDAKSFSDLFYCAGSQLLMAVTLRHLEDQTVRLNIYTIAVPPDAPAVSAAATRGGYWYWAGGLGLAMLVGGVVVLRRRRERTIEKPVAMHEPVADTPPAPLTPLALDAPHTPHAPVAPPQAPAPKPGIFLFGTFTVIDREGEDITNLFTPLLKELFLLILIYTIKYEKGVTLEKLNETLWSNMDEKNAKNNRAVNIGKLKSILEKLGDCTLKKETGRWIFVFNAQEVPVDFAQFVRIQNSGAGSKKPDLAETPREERAPAQMDQLLHLVQRGAFLSQENYEWLDDIKSDMSNTILEVLQKFSATLSVADHAELLINIANTIFFFDELNEPALAMKCRSLVFLGRHAIARNVFEKFASKYKDIYGEEFKDSFIAITAK